MAEPDFYRILGVPPSATIKQIKSAYRKLVKKYHPDLFVAPGEKARATAAFQKINHAYAVLGDPKRRSFYDQLRAQKTVKMERSPAAASGTPSARRAKPFLKPATLLWRLVVQHIAKHRIPAAIFFSLKRFAELVRSFADQLHERMSPSAFTRRSRWKGAFIFGSILVAWILTSLWKEPGGATNWVLLENTVVEPLRPISPTLNEPNWTVLAYYPSSSQCATDLRNKIKRDEQQGAKAFFDEREHMVAITVYVKDEAALAEEYFQAKLRTSAAPTDDLKLLREQARHEASEFVRKNGIIQRVTRVQCRELAHPKPEFWLWRIMKQAGLIS